MEFLNAQGELAKLRMQLDRQISKLERFVIENFKSFFASSASDFQNL